MLICLRFFFFSEIDAFAALVTLEFVCVGSRGGALCVPNELEDLLG